MLLLNSVVYFTKKIDVDSFIRPHDVVYAFVLCFVIRSRCMNLHSGFLHKIPVTMRYLGEHTSRLSVCKWDSRKHPQYNLELGTDRGAWPLKRLIQFLGSGGRASPSPTLIRAHTKSKEQERVVLTLIHFFLLPSRIRFACSGSRPLRNHLQILYRKLYCNHISCPKYTNPPHPPRPCKHMGDLFPSTFSLGASEPLTAMRAPLLSFASFSGSPSPPFSFRTLHDLS
jgi:hypothetical protein